MGQGDAAARGLDDLRNGREVALAVGVERARRPVVVAAHHLVHALGHRHIGNGIVDVGDALDLGVDRRPRRGVGDVGQVVVEPPRVEASRTGLGGDVLDQRQPVDHVAGLDRLDRRAAADRVWSRTCWRRAGTGPAARRSPSRGTAPADRGDRVRADTRAARPRLWPLRIPSITPIASRTRCDERLTLSESGLEGVALAR